MTIDIDVKLCGLAIILNFMSFVFPCEANTSIVKDYTFTSVTFRSHSLLCLSTGTMPTVAPWLTNASDQAKKQEVNGVSDQESKGWRDSLDDDDYAVLALRNFIFDICNQNGGGHGGSAIGMAAIGVALYKHVMRYNPSNPSWFDRDRFVLSNGSFLQVCVELQQTHKFC